MIKTPATANWVENKNYELIPDDNNMWKVRILTGDFIETVFSYGTVKFDEPHLIVSFDYKIVYSPDDDIEYKKQDFDVVAGQILHSIMLKLLDDE